MVRQMTSAASRLKRWRNPTQGQINKRKDVVMESLLRKCPFCGGDGEVLGGTAKEPWYWAQCIGCGVSTIEFGTQAEAIIAWNKRK
jgi:Lar family restriction alleviation protein